MQAKQLRGESLTDWQARLRRQSAHWTEEAAYFERLAAKLRRQGRVINVIQLVLVLFLVTWLILMTFVFS